MILGLGNVDCTGRLRVGTGIKQILPVLRTESSGVSDKLIRFLTTKKNFSVFKIKLINVYWVCTLLCNVGKLVSDASVLKFSHHWYG